MNVIGVLRIAAVVGLSAIKVMSTVLKIKEAKQQGLINPMFANNNSTPYQQPIYQQPINNTCNSPVQPQPAYAESRRYMNTPVYPQPQMATVHPQVASWNVTNNYSRPFNDPTSRRNINVQPTWQNPSWNTNYSQTINVQTPWQPMKRLEPNWVSYKPNVPNMGMSMPTYSQNNMNMNMNMQYPYGYGTTSSNHYDTLDGWVGNRQSIQQNQSYPNMNLQPLNWRDYECNNSYGQVNKNPPRPTPMFNWDTPYMKPWIGADGTVSMFGAPDGTPLWGNL